MAGTDAIAGPPYSNSGMMAPASQQPAPDPDAGNDTRESGDDAGYMELQGATKDADCEKVNVDGGVSQNLGCCNLFEPQGADTAKFSCGTCTYVKPNEAAPLEAGAPVRSLAKGMRAPNGLTALTNPPGLGAEQ